LRAPTRNPHTLSVIAGSVIAGSDPQSPYPLRHCGLRPAITIPSPSLRAPTRNPFNIGEVSGIPGTPGMTAGAACINQYISKSLFPPGLTPLNCTQTGAPELCRTFPPGYKPTIPNEENINLLCRRLVVETFNQSARRR